MIAKLIGRTGVTAGQDFIVNESAHIGSSPENEVRIIAPGVSRRHARIWGENDQFWLEDARATNGTFLNGGRVHREALEHLDVITLGRAVDLIFLQRDEHEPSVVGIERAPLVKIHLTDGEGAGTFIDVPKGELSFGRSDSCNVVLDSRAIGKIHARVQRTGNQVVLQDLQSVNGTFVNGKRIDIAVLKNGDVLNFAGVRSATISMDGEAAAAADEARAIRAAAAMPAFDQEWKTRFVWAPDEMAAIESARKDAQDLAQLRAPAPGQKAEAKPAVAAAKSAKPTKPAAKVTPGPAAPAPPTPAAVSMSAPLPTKPEAPVQPPPAAPPTASRTMSTVPSAPATSKPAVEPEPPRIDRGPLPKPIPAPPASSAVDREVLAAPGPAPTLSPAAPETEPASLMEEETRTSVARPRGVSQQASSCRLQLVSRETTVKLGFGVFTVGRVADADVRVDDRQVSRAHARITVDETAITIEDLQTVNGTSVNGRKIKAPEPLHHGDTLVIGATHFKVEVDVS